MIYTYRVAGILKSAPDSYTNNINTITKRSADSTGIKVEYFIIFDTSNSTTKWFKAKESKLNQEIKTLTKKE